MEHEPILSLTCGVCGKTAVAYSEEEQQELMETWHPYAFKGE